MKKTYGLLALVLIIAAALTACGGGGGGGGGAAPGGGGGGGGTASGVGTPITPMVPPITAFMQNVVSNDTGTYSEVFPKMANLWSLEQDFSLSDGFDSQFHWAEMLGVGGTFDDLGFFVPTGTGETFPSDQMNSDLSFYTPVMHAADGVKVAAVSDGASMAGWLPAGLLSGPSQVKVGTYVAFLNATSNSRLQQIVDLRTLQTSTNDTIYLEWQDAVLLNTGLIPLEPPPFYQVVIRDLNGNLLHTCYGGPNCTGTPCPGAMNGSRAVHGAAACRLDDYAAQQVVLSFEAASASDAITPAFAIIDHVSVTDSFGNNCVKNGEFETGRLDDGSGGGWTTNTPAEVQNITSGARTLEGLTVKRSFYTVPSKLWGRWVDVFENNTLSPISTTIAYQTWLGSDFAGSNGIIYNPVTGINSLHNGRPKALTSWDSSYALEGDGTRDVGLVFGNADDVYYQSATTGLVAVGPGGSIRTSPKATSGTTQDLNGVASDGSQFAAVGAGGVFLVSDDGVSWTSRVTNTTVSLNGVASSTTGTFAAVGATGAFLTWDGSSASLTPQSSGTTTTLRGVASDGGTNFEAVGVGGAILLWDGSGFTSPTSNTTADLNAIAWLPSITSVVAVGDGGTIVVSSDGGQTFGTPIITGTDNLNGVVSDGIGTFVAVGELGKIFTAASSDLATWAEQSSGTPNALNAIAWDGSQFVAVGAGGATLTSPDGATWTKWTSGSADLKGVASDTSGYYGNSYINVAYDIVVPAGQRFAIVNFVLMDGTDTGRQVGVIDARATDIDTAANSIVNSFWTDEQYLVGMTQQQLNAIKNFGTAP